MMINISITNINLQASKQKYTHILDTPALSLTKNKKTKTKQNKKKAYCIQITKAQLKKANTHVYRHTYTGTLSIISFILTHSQDRRKEISFSCLIKKTVFTLV